MTCHTIGAEIDVFGGEEQHFVKLDIEFSYLAGYPATGPSYASGGEPGAGAEVDFIHATLVDGDGLDPTAAVIDQWAKDWLNSDHGYDAACDLAEHEEDGPDPDEAYERMRELRDDRWQR